MTTTVAQTDSSAAASRALLYLNDERLRAALAAVTATGMSTLLGAVQRAGSIEEIEIIVRYQQARSKSRDQGSWPKELVEHIIQDLLAAAGAGGSQDKVKAAAGQLGLIARVHRVVSDRSEGRDGPRDQPPAGPRGRSR